MSFIQFESASAKEAERQAVRDTREKILNEAEAAYKRKEAQKQRAKERGDDQWMLPSIEAKLSSTQSLKKKKEKKKEKKEKKSKKSKKKKRRHSSSSSSDDSSDDEKVEWVEKTADTPKTSNREKSETAEQSKPIEREEWMSLPSSFLLSSREDKQRKKAEEEAKAKETCILANPGQSSRELNPYWKDGGTGLPEAENEQRNKSSLMDAAWLKKSLRRAQEQADEEGKTLEEVAAARWGSLDTINSMIREAENNMKRTYGYERNRRHNDEKSSSSTRNYYDRNDRDERSHRYRNRSPKYDDRESYGGRRKKAFMKPNEDDSSPVSSRKSSSSVKRWQKSEMKDKVNETCRDTEKLKTVEKRAEISSESSSEDEKESMNEKNNCEKSDNLGEELTEAEMNQIGAKIVKAEIMGDTELAEKLKAKLELAREVRKNKPALSSTSRPAKDEDVILTKTDARGMAKPLEPRSLYEEPKGGRRKGKKVDTHESGKRVRYFADDDKFTLHQMFQQEKGQSSADNDATFVKLASKSMDMDELFEQRITREDSDAKQDARDRSRAIKEHKKMEKSLDNCRLCFDSKNMLKHLIVAMGTKIYVSLPFHTSVTSGHCILAPIHHVSCQTQLDEDVWEELENFKKALTKMFMDKKEYPVFFEIAVGLHKFPHMKLECISLPEEVGSMAPMYFKKALLECETEWSTNKKVIELSGRDVRRAVPKGLPYFAVTFGNHGGFAHVVEDEKLFPRDFAQEIIGGMMDLDHALWRKPRGENFDQQKKKVLEFAKSWRAYDFTVKNDR